MFSAINVTLLLFLGQCHPFNSFLDLILQFERNMVNKFHLPFCEIWYNGV